MHDTINSVRSAEQRRLLQISFLLFAMEGGLFQFTNSLNSFGNNLFASALGATDTQISLVQMIPNVAAVLLLIPMGILADRAKSSRTMPFAVLLSMVLGYGLVWAAPSAGSWGLLLFFGALVLTMGGPVVYTAQWQNFFGDVVGEENRNSVMTRRNWGMYIVGIGAPLLCGFMMGQSQEAGGQIRVLRLFFLLGGILSFFQALVISGIPVPARRERQRFTVSAFAGSARELFQTRDFMRFFLPVVLFYMSWHFDWSMWYIGQMQYVGMTQSFLPIYNGIFNLGQLAAVCVLSRVVQKKSADYALCIGALGLMSCPVTMVVSSFLPVSMRVAAFTVLATVFNAPQCAANLCVVQILLRVAPIKHRSMAATLFTLSTTLSNCLMPYMGVWLYTSLGGNHRALVVFNAAAFLFRTTTFLLLVRRCRSGLE